MKISTMTVFRQMISSKAFSHLKRLVSIYLTFFMFFSCIQNKKDVEKTQITRDTIMVPEKSTLSEDLENGSFFQNPHGFYVLLTTNDLIIFTKNTTDVTPKFMLHFIKENNTFDNYSFVFSDKELKTSFDSLKVARIRIPQNNFFKIRIGQYKSDENIWVQEFLPIEVRTNPLLKYANEFPLAPE